MPADPPIGPPQKTYPRPPDKATPAGATPCFFSRLNFLTIRDRRDVPRANSCALAQLRSQELRQSRRITIRTEAALAASASGRKPAPYPAEGGSLWIERVAVDTPGRRSPCIAGLSVRQETPPRH